MRISSLQLQRQGINNILRQQNEVNRIQNEVATGKKINTPSDDPIGASQIILLNEQIKQNEQFQKNSDVALGHLELEDSILSSVSNVLQRVRELHLQGSNTILTDEDRAAIVQELQVKRDELLGLANSQNATGSYIFSGFQGGSQAYTKDANNNVTYNGDSGQRFLEVASGLTVPVNDSGFDIFDKIRTGNGTFHTIDSGAANTGSGTISTGTVVDQATYVQDTYTVTFVTNAAGNLAYQVFGATSGQVVPTLPTVTPANAPDYVDGASINFNGVQIEISGTPVAGDDFQLVPSAHQSVFTTLENIITAMSAPANNANQRAVLSNQMTRTLSELDLAMDSVNATRTKVGARLNVIETAEDVNANFILQSKTTLSSIEDVDLAEAATALTFQATVLQAAQQSFIKIQSLSLFNFL